MSLETQQNLGLCVNWIDTEFSGLHAQNPLHWGSELPAVVCGGGGAFLFPGHCPASLHSQIMWPRLASFEIKWYRHSGSLGASSPRQMASSISAIDCSCGLAWEPCSAVLLIFK